MVSAVTLTITSHFYRVILLLQSKTKLKNCELKTQFSYFDQTQLQD